MLFGNAIFGYIIGNFNEMMKEFKNYKALIEDEDKLNRFFNLLVRFNRSRELPRDFKDRIEKYFEYKWNNDRNRALSDDHGIAIFT